MTLSIYEASVPVYARRLRALSNVIDKAAAYAAERRFDQAVLLRARLFPDMFALDRQVRTACGHALRGSARLTGKEPTSIEGEASTLDDLKAWIARTLEIIEAVDIGKDDFMGEE
jgi:hypothetical protein